MVEGAGRDADHAGLEGRQLDGDERDAQEERGRDQAWRAGVDKLRETKSWARSPTPPGR